MIATTRIFYSLLITALLLVLGAGETLATLPAAETDAQPFLPGLPELRVEHFDTPADLVRDAYRRYELLAERSGAEVRFELSDFQTLYPGDYDDHLMTDIRTFGGGWTLRAVLSRTIEPELGIDEMRYEPFWEQQPSWLEHSFPHVVGQSVAAVFAGSISDDPPPAAITTYQVHVTYEGRSRTYDAAFYFELDQELRFSVQDHVSWGLHYVYRDLPELEAAEKGDTRQPERQRGQAMWSAKRCLSQTAEPLAFQGDADQNSEEHSYGRHSGAILFDFGCSCSESCTSRCAPATDPKCTDFGSLNVLRVHVPIPQDADQGGTSAGGDQEPASCKGAGACAVESCFDKKCNQVTVGFTGASFDFSGETVLEVSDVHTHICGTCTVISEGEGDTPTGGGGGVPDPGSVDDGNPDGTPIVIDLDGRGFHFTSVDEGVRFDIDVDRKVEQVAWTEPGGNDAFLAIDLNQNGEIDDGYELFGDRSFHTHDQEPNGYRALAEYDRADMGGNEDGWITADDADWQFLRLWLDENKNGRSEPHELSTLDDSNIAGIELAYRESRRQDRHGNWLRYRSKVLLAHPGGPPHTFSTDVYLLTREVEPR
ncbi:MAG TPA: hypothetical protein VHQ65_12935 [Thermoanaerobaculia bacterium]|nr:hypothetical protein [Thermoanaerobaculia bacterium]